VETLLKQVQDCADYSEAGGIPIGPSQQINVGYAKIFATGQFMSACRRWNEKPAAEKTWTHFKSHFAAAHRQHKQMKGETAAHAGFHSVNTDMTHTQDHMAGANTGALANLATATAAGIGVVAA
jgi:cellobiose-specific phosphotransferase system component IIA